MTALIRFLQKVRFFLTAAVIVFLPLIVSGCTQQAVIRGAVYDAAGEMLPGVTVHLEEQDKEALSNANGNYSIRAARGTTSLHFYKTGYTSARFTVDSLAFGSNEIPDVTLMPLPAEEGVFYRQALRYEALEHPRINRYTIGKGEPVFGTPVQPTLTLPWEDPEKAPEAGRPRFLAYKVQPYNALLHRLRFLTLKEEKKKEKEQKPTKEAGTEEKILIADTALPLIARILDDSDGQMVELYPGYPLEPGVYAIHWGALSGYDSLDPRAFLFEVGEKDETEGEPAKEGELKESAPK